MSPALPVVGGAEVIAALAKAGFVGEPARQPCEAPKRRSNGHRADAPGVVLTAGLGVPGGQGDRVPFYERAEVRILGGWGRKWTVDGGRG